MESRDDNEWSYFNLRERAFDASYSEYSLELRRHLPDDDDDIYIGPDGQRHVDNDRGRDEVWCHGSGKVTNYIFPSHDEGGAVKAMREHLKDNLWADQLQDDSGFFMDVREIPDHELAGWQAKLWLLYELNRRPPAFASPRPSPLEPAELKIAETVRAVALDLAQHYVFVVRPSKDASAPCCYPLCPSENEEDESFHDEVILSLEPFAAWDSLRLVTDVHVASGQVILFRRADDMGIQGVSLRKYLPPVEVQFCVQCLEDLWYKSYLAGIASPESEDGEKSLSSTPSLGSVSDKVMTLDHAPSRLHSGLATQSYSNGEFLSLTYWEHAGQPSRDLNEHPNIAPLSESGVFDSPKGAGTDYLSIYDPYPSAQPKKPTDPERRIMGFDGADDFTNSSTAHPGGHLVSQKLEKPTFGETAFRPVEETHPWDSFLINSAINGRPYLLSPFTTVASKPLLTETTKPRPSLRGGVTRTEVRTAAARVGMPVYPSERRFVEEYTSQPSAATPITPPRRNAIGLHMIHSSSAPSTPRTPGRCSPSPSPVTQLQLPIRLRTPSVSSVQGLGAMSPPKTDLTDKRKYDDIVARINRDADTERWLSKMKREEAARRKVENDQKKGLTVTAVETSDQDESDDFWIPTSDQLDAILGTKRARPEKTAPNSNFPGQSGDVEALRHLYEHVPFEFCTCRRPDNGKPMVQCQDPQCEVLLFHQACLTGHDKRVLGSGAGTSMFLTRPKPSIHLSGPAAHATALLQDSWICSQCRARRRREAQIAAAEATMAIEHLKLNSKTPTTSSSSWVADEGHADSNPNNSFDHIAQVISLPATVAFSDKVEDLKGPAWFVESAAREVIGEGPACKKLRFG